MLILLFRLFGGNVGCLRDTSCFCDDFAYICNNDIHCSDSLHIITLVA